MVNIEYANAYSEVLEILKYIPEEDYKKIPKDKIELFEKNANKDYKFAYTPLLTLEEQNVSKRARAIIAILFRDYWATEHQREKIKQKTIYDIKQIEKEKQKKYNQEELFKREYEQPKTNETSILEYKESIFKKFIYKIKRLFSIK